MGPPPYGTLRRKVFIQANGKRLSPLSVMASTQLFQARSISSIMPIPLPPPQKSVEEMVNDRKNSFESTQ